MPANRSRTSEWRRCLRQVHERGGSLEIAVAGNDDGGGNGHHLVWRVKLLAVTGDEIVVEQPTALGQTVAVQPGIELLGILAIGQNRWMFKTTNRGPSRDRGLRLAMPRTVERCSRRHYYRMNTGGLNLPEVEIWPLLDPKSVLVAERANELRFRDDGGGPRRAGGNADDESVMPEVGPRFTATLLNIGGGGLGLRVRPQDAQTLGRHKLFWLRFSLPPELDTPICATAKLAHTNMDSTQHVYAGLAFDFSFNPVHQRFVVEQICGYISRQQESQRRGRIDAAA